MTQKKEYYQKTNQVNKNESVLKLENESLETEEEPLILNEAHEDKKILQEPHSSKRRK